MIVDLFAGPGGWNQGLKRLGLHEFGIELDAATCATRAAAGLPTIRADVATYPAMRMAGKVEGLIASPPCQSFSRAGKRKGLADPRGQLVHEPLRWAKILRPEWLALEQVEDVLPIWREVAWQLQRLGYSTWTGILCAADYGTPQTRERAILMASRTRRVGPPEPTHSDQRRGICMLGLKPWVSMAEALGWDGEVDTNQHTGWVATASGNGDLHNYTREVTRPAPSVTTRADRWSLRNNSQANAAVRPLDQPAPTLFFGGRLNDVSWVLTRPATTVMGDPRIARPGHTGSSPDKQWQMHNVIRVTLEEAAVLQDFPADYPFQGNKSQRFNQVGNAVPASLAAAVVGTLIGRTAEVAA